MKKQPVVHKNEGGRDPYPALGLTHLDWRLALCGALGGSYCERVIVNRWAKVTCKRCLRMAPKAVKARLGIA